MREDDVKADKPSTVVFELSEFFFSKIIRRVLGAGCLVQFNKYFPVVSLLYGFLAASRLFYHNNHFIIARSQRSPEVMLFWTNETNFLSF